MYTLARELPNTFLFEFSVMKIVHFIIFEKKRIKKQLKKTQLMVSFVMAECRVPGAWSIANG